jgi:hypothetical protein
MRLSRIPKLTRRHVSVSHECKPRACSLTQVTILLLPKDMSAGTIVESVFQPLIATDGLAGSTAYYSCNSPQSLVFSFTLRSS